MFSLWYLNEHEMKIDTQRTFQYIKLEKQGRRHFCLQQNLLVLAWILFFKANALLPIVRADSEKISLRIAVNWLRKNFGLIRKKLIFLIDFASYKYQFRRSDLVISLPFYGHLCAPVHQGHKIFDLRAGTVVKVFEHDVSRSTIAEEIEQLQNVSKIDFAPSIRRSSVEGKWYEEDYVSGALSSSYKPLDSTALLKQFYDGLAQQLQTLILFQEPKAQNVREYIRDTIEILEISRLSGQKATESEFHKIKIFIDSVIERLCVEENYPVQLVFTHGDFCPANMLMTSTGIRVIDWEGAALRSALFDFYSYFFYRPVCRKVPVKQIVFEITKALPVFISSLGKKAPLISHELLYFGERYRWLYYVEQICVELKRSMTYTQLNLIDYILRYIDAFNLYEKLMEDHAKSSSNVHM